MSRVQLALNVSNLDEAVEFYTKLFRCEPAKVRPGYANFAIDDPPLKLVLIENGGQAGAINHLGVEVFSSNEVRESQHYFSSVGVATDVETSTTCCYAVQDKVWVAGPDGSRWEVYTVLADAGDVAPDVSADATCCQASTSELSTFGASSSCC